MIQTFKIMKNFCAGIWEYDARGNLLYMHHDTMTEKLCGRWLDYDEVSQLYFKKYVHKSDRKLWQQFMTKEYLRAVLDGEQPPKRFSLRLFREDGTMEWHEIFMETSNRDTLLLASRDMQDMGHNSVIVKAVDPDFDFVSYIDVDDGTCVLYPSKNTTAIVPTADSDDYRKAFHEFNRAYVIPEEEAVLTQKMEIPYVVNELRDKDEFILFATIQENGKLFYKKLRFCYLDDTKKTILLSRTDISDIVEGQRASMEEERLQKYYLDNLPVACCVMRIVFDEQGNPEDMVYSYTNQKYASLYGVRYGELIGKKYFELCCEADKSWLNYCYETAYFGEEKVFEKYRPEIKKHLMVYTFQPEKGSCGCVLQDISERRFLQEELEKSRQKLRRVLEASMQIIFQYDLKSDEVLFLKARDLGETSVIKAEDLFVRLRRDGIIEERDLTELQNALMEFKSGEHKVTLEFRARRGFPDEFRWYRITIFDYREVGTHERCAMGYLQDIDMEMKRQELLQQEAQTDALTGVLNTRAGQKEMRARLAEQRPNPYNIMLILDIDNFKQINDNEGHMVGDEVLKEFSWLLQMTFRSEDIIYRLGGDEFVVFMEKIEHPHENIAQIMKRFRDKLQQDCRIHVKITCSVGIYATNESCEFQEYYKYADEALYETKRRGKDGYTLRVKGESETEKGAARF